MLSKMDPIAAKYGRRILDPTISRVRGVFTNTDGTNCLKRSPDGKGSHETP
jgi:hypothetical protein